MGFNLCILNKKIEKLNQWDTHLEFEFLTNDCIISLERGVFLVQVTYLTIVFLKQTPKPPKPQQMKLIAILVAFLALPLCSASPPGLRITSDEVAADMSRRSGGTCKSSWCASPDQTNRSAFDCFVDLTDNADKCFCQRGVAVLSAPYIDVKPGVSKDWSFSRSLGEFGKQELQRYMCCEDISNPRFSNLDSITSDKIAGETCGRDNLDTYEQKRFFTNLCFLLFLFIICVPAGIWLAKKIVDFIIWWRSTPRCRLSSLSRRMDAVPDDIESNTRGCQATKSDIEMS
jgi:hypothetical protein